MKKCYLRSNTIRRGIDKYHKFEVALERLSREQDIQYLIEKNRVSSLLHKMAFLSRQRLAIKYSRKYTINSGGASHRKVLVQDDANKVLNGFDPVYDEQDRRMLFEVTGLRLNKEEF